MKKSPFILVDSHYVHVRITWLYWTWNSLDVRFSFSSREWERVKICLLCSWHISALRNGKNRMSYEHPRHSIMLDVTNSPNLGSTIAQELEIPQNVLVDVSVKMNYVIKSCMLNFQKREHWQHWKTHLMYSPFKCQKSRVAQSANWFMIPCLLLARCLPRFPWLKCCTS